MVYLNYNSLIKYNPTFTINFFKQVFDNIDNIICHTERKECGTVN